MYGDFHDVIFLVSGSLALLLMLAGILVTALKRLWLGTLGFLVLTVLRLYALVVIPLMLRRAPEHFDPRVSELVSAAFWLLGMTLITAQFLWAERKRA
jgi:hypothetical protein